MYTSIPKCICTYVLTYPVSPHHEVTESHVVVETDLSSRDSGGSQDLLGELHVGHGLQSLVVVPQLAVQSQQTYQAEVTQVLVQGVVAKVTGH